MKRAFKMLFVLALIVCVAEMAYAATKTIIFFTIGAKPNTTETAELAALSVVPVLNVKVRRAGKVTKAETTDFVAGTIPPIYRTGGVDSGAPLYPELGATNIANGVSKSLAGGGSLQFTVGGGNLRSLSYIVPDGGT
jgi:hypothetical protein